MGNRELTYDFTNSAIFVSPFVNFTTYKHIFLVLCLCFYGSFTNVRLGNYFGDVSKQERNIV